MMKCIANSDVGGRPHPIICIKENCIMWTGYGCAIRTFGLDKLRKKGGSDETATTAN